MLTKSFTVLQPPTHTHTHTERFSLINLVCGMVYDFIKCVLASLTAKTIIYWLCVCESKSCTLSNKHLLPTCMAGLLSSAMAGTVPEKKIIIKKLFLSHLFVPKCSKQLFVPSSAKPEAQKYALRLF